MEIIKLSPCCRFSGNDFSPFHTIGCYRDFWFDQLMFWSTPENYTVVRAPALERFLKASESFAGYSEKLFPKSPKPKTVCHVYRCTGAHLVQS